MRRRSLRMRAMRLSRSPRRFMAQQTAVAVLQGQIDVGSILGSRATVSIGSSVTRSG